MVLYYRMCRYSGDILPVSEFTIDEWDCDRVCQMNPYGPKVCCNCCMTYPYGMVRLLLSVRCWVTHDFSWTEYS